MKQPPSPLLSAEHHSTMKENRHLPDKRNYDHNYENENEFAFKRNEQI